MYLIRGKAGNLGGRGRERRRGRGGREARAVVDVPLVGAPQAADAGGQLLWPEDSVGDVEERVGRRRGGGGDGAAPGATLRSEIGCYEYTIAICLGVNLLYMPIYLITDLKLLWRGILRL